MTTVVENKTRTHVLILSIFSIIWTLIILFPHLFDPFRVPIDVQNHYWMAKFQDPSLFPDDLLAYSEKIRYVQIFDCRLLIYPRSFGYTLLFWTGSFFLSPLLISKLLIFLLLPISFYLLYKYGSHVRNAQTGLILCVLFLLFNLASPDSLSLASGLQRSFALPLFIGFLYYLSVHKFWKASALIIGAALFYLPNMPLMVLTYIILIIRDQDDWSSIPGKKAKLLIPLFLAIAVSVILAGWAVFSSAQVRDVSTVSNIVRDVPILKDPRHQPGGAAPFFLRLPWIGRAGIFESYPEAVIILVILVLSGLSYLLLSGKESFPIPAHMRYFLIAGFVMYLLSYISLIFFSLEILYMPSRYVRGPLFLSSLYYLGFNAGIIPVHFKGWYRNASPKTKASVGIGIIISMTLLTGIIFGFSPPDWLGWLLVVLSGVVLCGALLLWLFTLLPALQPAGHKPDIHMKERLLFGLWGTICLALFILYSHFVGFGTINPTQHERDLYHYAETLPKDTLLAGSPEELNAVPLFAKRNILFFHLRPRDNAPILDFFSAYYAEDSSDIMAFCEEHGIDYLVYNQRDFNQDYLSQEDFFYQPYNARIAEIVSHRDQFILPEGEKVFNSGPLSVVKCEPSAFAGRQQE